MYLWLDFFKKKYNDYKKHYNYKKIGAFTNTMRMILFIIYLVLAPTISMAKVIGPDRPFLNMDLGLSILGEAGHREHFARSYALGVRGGLRWGNWGVFAQIEPAYWLVSNPLGGEELQGALNIGIGGEKFSVDGFIRTALSVGPSILVNAGEVDKPGTTGFYFELRPAGLRWQIAENFVVGFDPILLSLMMPVLEGIPLIELEYRTTVTGEYVF